MRTVKALDAPVGTIGTLLCGYMGSECMECTTCGNGKTIIVTAFGYTDVKHVKLTSGIHDKILIKDKFDVFKKRLLEL